MNVRECFARKKFIITTELSPPRGTDCLVSIKIAEAIKEKVDAVNVTDNQRAIMRMSALAFSHLLYEHGINPIMQVCCRDKNRLYLQSEILGACALGINTISCMTGDHPLMGDHPESKPVFDLDSVQLIRIIKNLTKGKSLSGKKLQGTPDLFLGAVINPFAKPFELQLVKMKKKIDAGAEFFQTQPFFDKESIEQFLEKIHPLKDKLKVLIGIVPLKSLKMIEFMNTHVLSSPISLEITERISNAEDPEKEGITIAVELANSIKKIVDGVHIMPIGIESVLPSLLDRIN